LSTNYKGDTLKIALENLGGVLVRSVDLATGEIIEPLPVVQFAQFDAGRAVNFTAGERGGVGTETADNLQNKPVNFTAGERGGVGVIPNCYGFPLSISTYQHAEKSKAEPACVPFVKWRQGASYLKVSKAEPSRRMGGGFRGVVKGFSVGSRARMMNWLAGIKLTATLPVFVTLTYPDTFPEPKESKKHLKRFIQRLKRALPNAGGVWKLEPQERGAPHYHLLIWGSSQKELRGFVPFAWNEIAGGGDEKHLLFHKGKFKKSKHCVEQVRCAGGMKAYASKYLGKTFEVAGWDSKEVGKFWGIFNPDNIPMGEWKSKPLTRKQAVEGIRYIKRAIHAKARAFPSLSIRAKYGNQQWIDKIFGGDE